MGRRRFIFSQPAFFRKRFAAERFLWDCATAEPQLNTDEAIDKLLATGMDGLDSYCGEYVRFLLSERYKSLINSVFSQMTHAATRPTVTERELKRQKFSLPPEQYEIEVQRVQQKKAAKVYMTMMVVNVPGCGDVPVTELTPNHIKEWERQYRLFAARARKYEEARLPWVRLLERFPNAKKVGDIPNWQEEISKDPLLVAQVKQVEKAA